MKKYVYILSFFTPDNDYIEIGHDKVFSSYNNAARFLMGLGYSYNHMYEYWSIPFYKNTPIVSIRKYEIE